MVKRKRWRQKRERVTGLGVPGKRQRHMSTTDPSTCGRMRIGRGR
jgi:hypothetical protein